MRRSVLIAGKTLPPTQLFCSANQANHVTSTLKKADLGPDNLLRTYEIEGAQVDTPIVFLGRETTVRELNLLEEEQGQAALRTLRSGPCAIKTIKFQRGNGAK